MYKIVVPKFCQKCVWLGTDSCSNNFYLALKLSLAVENDLITADDLNTGFYLSFYIRICYNVHILFIVIELTEPPLPCLLLVLKGFCTVVAMLKVSESGATEEDRLDKMMSNSTEMYQEKNWTKYKGQKALPEGRD